MPAITAVTINDGAATPVAHTFTPIGKDGKNVHWLEQTTPSPANILGAKRIGYKQERVYDQQRRLTGESRVIMTLSLPVLEVLGNSATGITPPPTLAYIEKARVEFVVPERSTLQERKDLRVLLANLMNHVMTQNVIDNMQPYY